jgi:hypothetical protein
MSDKKKKELRRVRVSVTDSNGTDIETYRIIVPPDSTTEKEMEWRMEYLKGFGTWGIESDNLIKEI